MSIGPSALDDAPQNDADTLVPLLLPPGCSESSSDSDDNPSGLPGLSGASLGNCPPKRAGGNPDAQIAQDGEDGEFARG